MDLTVLSFCLYWSTARLLTSDHLEVQFCCSFFLWALYAVGCGEIQSESSVQTEQSTVRTEEGSFNRSAAVCRIGLCLSNCNRSAALVVKVITYIISVHTHSLSPFAAGGCHEINGKDVLS